MFNSKPTLKQHTYGEAPQFLSTRATAEERAEHYIKDRWHDQYAYYLERAEYNRRHHQRLQVFIGIVAVLVPVLLGFSAGITNWAREVAVSGVWALPLGVTVPLAWAITEQNLGIWIQIIQAIPAILSGMVAGAAALENVMSYGSNWRAFQFAADGMERERAMFEANAGIYRNSPNAYSLFVERCEDVIAQESGRFFARQAQQGDDDPEDPEDLYEELMTSGTDPDPNGTPVATSTAG